jgi:hypothetical protein
MWFTVFVPRLQESCLGCRDRADGSGVSLGHTDAVQDIECGTVTHRHHGMVRLGPQWAMVERRLVVEPDPASHSSTSRLPWRMLDAGWLLCSVGIRTNGARRLYRYSIVFEAPPVR